MCNFTLNFDDFENLLNVIKDNKPLDKWWVGRWSTLVNSLNTVRNNALSISWFQGEAPSIIIDSNIAEQINDLRNHLCQ